MLMHACQKFSTRTFRHLHRIVRHSFLCYCSRHCRGLHSFPTRRSSDLALAIAVSLPGVACELCNHAGARSEEHTSELQSRGHLVCRLLLEKKINLDRRIG